MYLKKDILSDKKKVFKVFSTYIINIHFYIVFLFDFLYPVDKTEVQFQENISQLQFLKVF